MKKIISAKHFQSKNTTKLAQSLLGKFLVRKYRGKTKAYMLTEVEAYDGPEDRASHASRGKTDRNKVMFGKAGNWYVYFTYGMHWMLNIVTGPKEYPGAILIRGLDIISGPARLTKALYIDKKQDGKSANKNSGLWLEDRGIKIKSHQIGKFPRIGVDYAGSLWSKKKWRFTLK